MQCAQHPNVETELRCGRCDTPICPRCLVQSPVGARCKSCSNLGRPTIYRVGATDLGKGLAVSLGMGVAVGLVWGFVFQAIGLAGFYVTASIFGWILGFIIGTPLGYGFARLLDRVTGRKRGPRMQGVAVAGIAAAWLMYAAASQLFGGNDPLGGLYRFDAFSLILAVAASAAAWARLR